MKVLAREGLIVSYYAPDGVRIHHKKITADGLLDQRTGAVKEGAVEVPESDFYVRAIAAGELVRAKG